jgi:hypothetical protein
VIISPLESDEVDAATDSIRALWRGRARVVRAGFTTEPVVAVEPVQLKAAAGDPLSVSVARFGSAAGSGARIVRAVPTEDDLAWSRAGEHALVLWPTPDRPKGAIARASIDTIGGVSSGEILVVSGFPRRWTYPPDSIRGAEVIARWVDGEPAAVEWKSESGCIRSVAVPVNPVGDLPLRTSFINFAAAMAQACAGRSARNPISPTSLASLAGRGGLAPRDAFLPRDDVRSTVAPWLLGLALVAAIGELFVRRRRDLYLVPEARRPSAAREAA